MELFKIFEYFLAEGIFRTSSYIPVKRVLNLILAPIHALSIIISIMTAKSPKIKNKINNIMEIFMSFLVYNVFLFHETKNKLYSIENKFKS